MTELSALAGDDAFWAKKPLPENSFEVLWQGHSWGCTGFDGGVEAGIAGGCA